jgi:hypothetical protein
LSAASAIEATITAARVRSEAEMNAPLEAAISETGVVVFFTIIHDSNDTTPRVGGRRVTPLTRNSVK